ncbi:MAG: DUF6049 family protein [Egibacteraceae bacterium]
MTHPRVWPGSGAGPAAAVLVALAAAVLVLSAPSASAQLDRDDDPSLAVTALQGVLAPGGELQMRVRVANPGADEVEGLRVVGTVHSAVASRFAFQMAVDDGQLGAVVEGFSEEIDLLRAGDSTEADVTHTAAELGLRRVDQFGVYPLRLQLQDGGAVLDEVRTAVVFAGGEVGSPVRTALLLPVTAPPMLRADGTYDRQALLDELGQAGRLQGLIGSLAGREGFPATVVPDALLLDTASALSGGFAARDERGTTDLAPDDHLPAQAARLLERTRAVATRADVDVLAMPYARADLGALLDGGMDLEAARHVAEGSRAVADHTGAEPLAGAIWPAAAPTPATASLLDDVAVDTVVLSELSLDIPDGRGLTPSPVRELASTAGWAPTVLVPDPWLEAVLARDGAPDGVAIGVQRIVAETAAVYFERPFTEDVRGLVLAPPQTWNPVRGFAGALMDALEAAPWTEPATLSQLARTVDPEPTRARLDVAAARRSRQLSPTYVTALEQARHALGSLATVLAGVDDRTPRRFDLMLRAAASVSYRTPPESAEGREMIAAVAGTAAGLYSSVSIEEGPQVWMEAEGPVPVTVTNDAEVPVRIRVRLESQRFIFDEEPIGQPPDELGGWVLPAGGTRTLTFQATAVTPGGRAPVRVFVEDVDGAVTLAEETLVVRSTAVSIAALVVTVGAGLFLLVWGVRQVTHRRRGQREAGDEAAPQPPAQARAQERR